MRGKNVQDKIYGTGLGLYLGKKILTLIGANLRFEQEVITVDENKNPKDVRKFFIISIPCVDKKNIA